MRTGTREERYRQVAEGELQRGNPRDPVLNESIEAAAEKGSALADEYTQRRTAQMLADEEERETVMLRRMKLHRELDEPRHSLLVRTLTLIAIIVAVAAIGYWLMKN
jgi:hypothetical protein